MSWIVWLVVACALGAGEVLSGSSFFLAPFAVGACLLPAPLPSSEDSRLDRFHPGLGPDGDDSQAVRAASAPDRPALRTGGAALIGKRAIVLERIANHEGVGRVRIDSEVWTARSLDDDHVIEPGTTVQVVDIKGATALVMELRGSEENG